MEGAKELYDYANKLVKKNLYLRPKKSCEVIFTDFFNSDVKLSKYKETRYADILCEFKEIDGRKSDNLIANLRIPLLSCFKPLYELLENYHKSNVVHVKIERENLKFFKITIIEDDNDG